MATPLCRESYQKGYDAAFGEIYSVSAKLDHHAACGSCRVCGVITTVIEDMVEQLAAWMEPEEFWLFSGLVETVRERREKARNGEDPWGCGADGKQV